MVKNIKRILKNQVHRQVNVIFSPPAPLSRFQISNFHPARYHPA
jgi:hypothetical protein